MKTSLRLALRRAAVIAAVAGSLLLGAATIRAAGQWTASEAPLAAPPVTVESVQGQLAAERERSAALTEQLAAIAGQAGDLQAALDTANGQIATDAQTAKALRDRIAASRERLSALNRQIAATARQAAQAARARTVVVTRTAPAPASTPRPTPEPEHDD